MIAAVHDGHVIPGGGFVEQGGGFVELDGFTRRTLETARRLLALDFSTPTDASKPTTAGGVITGRTAERLWPCEEASGTPTCVLTGAEFTPVGAPTVGQIAAGRFNGTNAYSMKALEILHASGDYFECDDADVMDLDGESRTLVIDFAVPRAPATDRAIAGKGTTTDGWSLVVNSNGFLKCVLYIGGAPTLTTITVNHCDGVRRRVYLSFDYDAGEVRLRSRLGSASSSLGTPASTAGAMRIGSGPTGTAAHFRLEFLAVFKGASAEGFTAADIVEPCGTDPTGLLTTYSRTGALTEIVGDDETAGLYAMTYGASRVALGWSAELTQGAGFGLRCNSAVTNLHTHSIRLSNWTASNVTVSDAQASSPRGFKEATKITATADNGYAFNGVACSGSTLYSHSVCIKRATAATVTGRIIHWNSNTSSEAAAVAFSLSDDRWVRIDVSNTTTPGQNAFQFRLEIDTSGHAIYAWGATSKTGNPSLLVLNDGSSTPTGATTAKVAGAAGELCHARRGEIAVRFVGALGAFPTLVDVTNGSDNDNRRLLGLISGAASAYRWNATGAATAFVSASGTLDTSEECVARAQWNASTGLLRARDDATMGTAAGVPWTHGEDLTTITLGAASDGSLPLDGLISEVEIYDRPRRAA